MNELIHKIDVIIIPLVLAITIPEVAKAYVAFYLGDMTARSQGRLSWNFLKCIDPIGSVILPLSLYLLSNGQILIGYPKLIPVDVSQLRNPRRDSLFVALAGSCANFAMASFWTLCGLASFVWGWDSIVAQDSAKFGIQLNLLFIAFNLIPIPPLAGGFLLMSLLPEKLAYQFSKVERYGIFIVIGLAILGLMKYWFGPVLYVLDAIRRAAIYPIYLLLN
jgi:Zn-dependent protease